MSHDVIQREAMEVSGQALIDISRDLPALYAACKRRVREVARDGYPTASLGGGSPANIVDENGVPMPPLSDPVGELATEPPESNPALAAFNQAKALERQAAATAKRAEREAEQARTLLILAVATPKEDPESEKPADALDWCSVCVRVSKEGSKVMSPTTSVVAIHAGENPKARCTECEAWAMDAAGDPTMPRERPSILVLMGETGKRIFDKDINEAVELLRCQRAWISDDADHEHECQFTSDPHPTLHACRWCEDTVRRKQ